MKAIESNIVCPICWGLIKNAELVLGKGVKEVKAIGTGIVDIEFNDSVDKYMVVLTLDYTEKNDAQIIRYNRLDNNKFRVDTHDLKLIGRDQDFSFMVYGA